MTKTQKWKLCGLLIGIVGLFISGLIVGRKTIKTPEPGVIYVPKDSIRDSIPPPQFIEVIKYKPQKIDTLNLVKFCIDNHLADHLIPVNEKTDTVTLTVDTMSIIAEYITLRQYDVTLYDTEELGKCIVHPSIQFNKLQSLSYDLMPVQAVQTVVTPKPKYEPFLIAGLGTSNSFIFGGGIYKDHIGASLTYRKDFKTADKEFALMLNYKF